MSLTALEADSPTKRDCLRCMTMIVENITRQCMLGDRIAVARTFMERTIGLLSRGQLTTGEGLWIDPCTSIHTLFMRFSIDVCFLSDQLEILKIAQALPPWNLSFAPRGASSVLELPAGVIAETGTKCRDRLAFQDRRE